MLTENAIVFQTIHVGTNLCTLTFIYVHHISLLFNKLKKQAKIVFASAFSYIPAVTMTICYTRGYILDIPQRGALICPRSGIEA